MMWQVKCTHCSAATLLPSAFSNSDSVNTSLRVTYNTHHTRHNHNVSEDHRRRPTFPRPHFNPHSLAIHSSSCQVPQQITLNNFWLLFKNTVSPGAPEVVWQVWRPPYQSNIWYGDAITNKSKAANLFIICNKSQIKTSAYASGAPDCHN